MVQISGQYGDVLSEDAIGPMHGRLNKIFESQMRRDYGSKVKELAIILRVSGELWDFKTEGPERLFYRRKGKYLEIDLVVPRSSWEERSIDEVRSYLAAGLREAFGALEQRLVKVDKDADIKRWRADFEKCLNQFEREAGKHEVERKYTTAKVREAWRARIRKFSESQ